MIFDEFNTVIHISLTLVLSKSNRKSCLHVIDFNFQVCGENLGEAAFFHPRSGKNISYATYFQYFILLNQLSIIIIVYLFIDEYLVGFVYITTHLPYGFGKNTIFIKGFGIRIFLFYFFFGGGGN